MKWGSRTALLAALALACAAPGWAGPKNADRLNIPPGKALKRVMTLTPKQRQDLERLKRDSNAESRALRSKISQARNELDALYRDYALNADRVRSLHQAINQAQAQLLDSHLAAQKRVREILSAEQFLALQDSLRDGEATEAPSGRKTKAAAKAARKGAIVDSPAK